MVFEGKDLVLMASLIEQEGPYRKLYELQFREGARKKVIPIGKKR